MTRIGPTCTNYVDIANRNYMYGMHWKLLNEIEIGMIHAGWNGNNKNNDYIDITHIGFYSYNTEKVSRYCQPNTIFI
jgi:hypothetical protein